MSVFVCLLIPAFCVLSSCQSQNHAKQESTINNSVQSKTSSEQIGEYIPVIFQDSKNTLWFGTLDKGVARFRDSTLTYFTEADGLIGNRVVAIVEDDKGNLWFGTQSGLSKFDGKSFTNYSEKDGLCHFRVSQLYIDSRSKFWVGTWGGVCTFDGQKFEKFPLPYPIVKTHINVDTKDWITLISEDDQGKIYFGRDGYGLCKFDGQSFIHFTTQDGLNSNNVMTFAEDMQGNFWIGTRVAERDLPESEKRFGKGGLNKMKSSKITFFPQYSGLSESDVYAIFIDNLENIWVGTTSKGVYKFDGLSVINYEVPKAIMSIFQDNHNNMWFGCAGGLYKLDRYQKVVNVLVDGPW